MAYIIRHEEDYNENDFRNNSDVMFYRTRTIVAGETLDIKTFPVYRKKTGHVLKRLPSKEKMQRQNEKRAKQMLVHLMNANFGAGDLHATCTYSGPELPTEEQCANDVKNYMRRINRERGKRGLPPARYIYVIEGKTEEDKRTRVHTHIILEKGLDRDTVERLWQCGKQTGAARGTCNADRLQPGDMQLTALATYLAKDPKGRKRWKGSKNLKKPEVFISDHKIKRAHIAKLARNEVNPIEFFAKLYPGYQLRDMEIKTNQYISGAAVCVKMQRIGGGTRRKE